MTLIINYLKALVVPPKRKDGYNYTMHYFRAIAILSIVVGHTLAMHHAFGEYETYEFKLIVNTICDSLFNTDSHLFVFISGYLFYVINKETKIIDFYKRKIKNLLFPYLCMSLILMAIGAICINLGLNMAGIVRLPSNQLELIKIIINGKTQGPYWYMPFILNVFLFSIILVKLEKRRLVEIALFFALIPLCVHRSDYDLFKPGGGGWDYIANFLYFNGSFYFGVIFAIYYEKIKLIASENYKILIALVLFTLCLMLSDRVTHLVGGMYAAHYVQKTALICLIVLLLDQAKPGNLILDLLARYSFTIYFTHLFIANVISRAFSCISFAAQINDIARIIILEIVVVISCIVVSVLLKLLTGRFSKLVIGA